MVDKWRKVILDQPQCILSVDFRLLFSPLYNMEKKSVDALAKLERERKILEEKRKICEGKEKIN